MATATAVRISDTFGFKSTSTSRSIKDRWLIRTDVCTTDISVIETAEGLPQAGDKYVDDDGNINDKLFVIDVDCDRSDTNPTRWEAIVSYSTKLNTGFETTDDPSRLLDFDMSSVPYQETVDYCYDIITISNTQSPSPPDWGSIKETENNVLIENTAKDIISGVVSTRFNKQISIIQAEDKGFDPDIAQDYVGSTNSKDLVIAGVAIKANEGLLTNATSKLKNPNSSREGFPDGVYWQTNYTIQVQKGGWYTKVVNAGFNQLKVDGSETKTNPITYGDIDPNSDSKTQQVSEQQKLDLNGAVILRSSTDVYYRVIWTIYPKDWGSAIDFVSER